MTRIFVTEKKSFSPEISEQSAFDVQADTLSKHGIIVWVVYTKD